MENSSCLVLPAPPQQKLHRYGEEFEQGAFSSPHALGRKLVQAIIFEEALGSLDRLIALRSGSSEGLNPPRHSEIGLASPEGELKQNRCPFEKCCSWGEGKVWCWRQLAWRCWRQSCLWGSCGRQEAVWSSGRTASGTMAPSSPGSTGAVGMPPPPSAQSPRGRAWRLPLQS